MLTQQFDVVAAQEALAAFADSISAPTGHLKPENISISDEVARWNTFVRQMQQLDGAGNDNNNNNNNNNNSSSSSSTTDEKDSFKGGYTDVQT